MLHVRDDAAPPKAAASAGGDKPNADQMKPTTAAAVAAGDKNDNNIRVVTHCVQDYTEVLLSTAMVCVIGKNGKRRKLPCFIRQRFAVLFYDKAIVRSTRAGKRENKYTG